MLRSARPWDIRADLELNLGDRVIFQGFNSRIPLIGRLYLSQRGLETAMRANGAIGVSQTIGLGIIGEYVAKVFLTQNNHPQYIIKTKHINHAE